MREETLVLGRHECVHDMVRDGFIRNKHPVLVCKFGDQRAITRMDSRRNRRLILLQLGDGRHLAAKGCEIQPQRHETERCKHEAQNDQAAGPNPNPRGAGQKPALWFRFLHVRIHMIRHSFPVSVRIAESH